MADHTTTAQTDALNRAIAVLGEHFDNVLILANTNTVDREGENSTRYAVRSQGNHFAHRGHAEAWLSAERAKYVRLCVEPS